MKKKNKLQRKVKTFNYNKFNINFHFLFPCKKKKKGGTGLTKQCYNPNRFSMQIKLNENIGKEHLIVLLSEEFYHFLLGYNFL